MSRRPFLQLSERQINTRTLQPMDWTKPKCRFSEKRASFYLFYLISFPGFLGLSRSWKIKSSSIIRYWNILLNSQAPKAKDNLVFQENLLYYGTRLRIYWKKKLQLKELCTFLGKGSQKNHWICEHAHSSLGPPHPLPLL